MRTGFMGESHRRRRRFIAVSAMFPIAGWAVSQETTNMFDEMFDDSFRAIKRDNSLQFDLPPAEPIEPPDPPPDWLKALAEFFEPLLNFFAAILPYLFYGLLAAAVLMILFFVLRDLIDVKFPSKKTIKDVVKEVEKPLYAPTSEEARILLETVDALAADGRYEDAVHTLLFRSIQDIDLKRPNVIRRSLTSREIAALDILTPATREAFSLIGRVVETSYFGGQPLGKADYETCREAYVQFAVPKAWES